MTETSERGVAPQSRVQQDIREVDGVDTSTSRQEHSTKQGKRESHNDRLPTQTTTQRRVEESHASPLFREQQTEDPFRTLRSFHEKQRGERQWENTHHTSVTLHSIFEGAVGGVGANPKPQRVTKKHQPQDQPQTADTKSARNQPFTTRQLSSRPTQHNDIHEPPKSNAEQDLREMWFSGTYQENVQGRSLLQVLQSLHTLDNSVQNVPCNI